MKLFMIVIGCKPSGRHTEQHDVFFGIANELKELVPALRAFWPEAEGKLHIDSWREVTSANGYRISVLPRSEAPAEQSARLYFINLGGYKPDDLEEYHYKMVIAAPSKEEAIAQSKASAFFKHTGFKGANSHIDDKYGVDVDDVEEIEDILPENRKAEYTLVLEPDAAVAADPLHIGYLKLSALQG